MNYSELHYILCIAKHQNLTRAAQELYISQPTLTKHLQKLEREMGAKLFSRNGNTYVPTYTGRKYMEYARKILQVKQDWEKELKDLTENNEGELNIAVPLMRSSCMIPQIMAEFSEKYPNVNVSIWEEAYSIQEKLLLNDRSILSIAGLESLRSFLRPLFSLPSRSLLSRFIPFLLLSKRRPP